MVDNYKKLIINADDFGISHSANQAIVDCFKNGVLDSTTLMVNMPNVPAAANLALSYKIPVGLHFNVTLGEPISDKNTVSSLLDKDGCFYSRRKFILNYFKKKINIEHIKLEFKSQITRYFDLGLDLDHIDSHQHIHILPKVFDIVAHYCEENNTPLRSAQQCFNRNLSLKKKIRAKILSFLVLKNHRKWQNRVRMNGCLMSIFDNYNANTTINFSHYQELINHLPNDQITELMIHPVVKSNDATEKSLTRISDISHQEYQILMSEQFLNLLENSDINRMLFSDIS